MKKLAPLAALLIAASGAVAQSECEKACESEKAAVQTVSTTSDDCQKACEGEAAVQTVSLTADDCEKACESSCETTAVQTVSLTGDDCQTACESACEGSALQTVSLTGDDCQKSCDGEAQAVQLVAYPTDMPKMNYVVGDKVTQCSAEAGNMASACDSLKVGYLVADKKYDCQMQAGEAYAKELHGYLDRVTRVSFVVGDSCTPCPLAAKEMASACDSLKVQYKVGNTVFDCAEKAIMASAMAYGMSHQAQLTRAINGKATACDASFKAAQACSETKATYLVNGKATECHIEADCMLTMSRIEAALAAAQQVAGS